MKGKKHTAEQIIKKLREADAMIASGKTVGQVCQSLEISEQTLHRWRNQYGGMKSEEARRLKELDEENRRLKKLLAEAELDRRSSRRHFGETTEPDPQASGHCPSATDLGSERASGLSCVGAVA